MIKELVMPLSKEQEELYKKTMDEAKKQLGGIDELMQLELQKVRERLAELQEAKKSFRMIYEGTAKLLGVESELEEESVSASSSSVAKM
jgi:response regulator RpfG family c-di-GMP phosphodiesterase